MEKQKINVNKGVFTFVDEDGNYHSTEVLIEENGQAITAKGPTLACWMGIHAYSNGICVNCGKKAPWYKG